VFILFPRSWPKRRHHKRRLVAPATLDLLGVAMSDGAELRLATDDRDYLAWIWSTRLRIRISCGWRSAPPIGASAEGLARDALRGEGARRRAHAGVPAVPASAARLKPRWRGCAKL